MSRKTLKECIQIQQHLLSWKQENIYRIGIWGKSQVIFALDLVDVTMNGNHVWLWSYRVPLKTRGVRLEYSSVPGAQGKYHLRSSVARNKERAEQSTQKKEEEKAPWLKDLMAETGFWKTHGIFASLLSHWDHLSSDLRLTNWFCDDSTCREQFKNKYLISKDKS